MNNVSNPNDYKVVDFHNKTDFMFTPAMGCMYDGRPIFGITGAPGVAAGESIKLPYHIGHRLAMNLAKVVMLKQAPTVDAAGIPTGVPLWSTEGLEALKNTYITEMYSETKPIAVSETDKLLAKVEEYKKAVDSLLAEKGIAPTAPIIGGNETVSETPKVASAYQDKAEVIAELTKRNIKFNTRSTKAELEKLLA